MRGREEGISWQVKTMPSGYPVLPGRQSPRYKKELLS